MSNTKIPQLLVCNCQKSMQIDGARLSEVLAQGTELRVHTELCRGQIASVDNALTEGGALHIACTQEAPLFRELAAEKATAGTELKFTNIRERAGWCAAKADTLPKMAALLAEAAVPIMPAGVATLKSSGACLVYGRGQAALDVATELCEWLSVTLLLLDADDVLLPETISAPIYAGRIRTASGHLGAFDIEVDGYAAMLPSSKNSLQFAMPRDGARSSCDLIFDMSGGSPLFRDEQRREGYLRVDPAHPAALARAMLRATDLVGEFEKPLYVSYDASICAHSRSQKVGCTNCLDHCPVGAIASDGDGVKVDAAVCDGCGACSATCPTGAVSYAYPRREDFVARLTILLGTYHSAGGVHPVVLFHDEKHGAPLISAMARYGRGLPANVLPVSCYSVLELGHDLLAAALALGAEHVVILVPPENANELYALEAQVSLVSTVLVSLGYEGERQHLIIERDSDAVEAILYGLPVRAALPVERFMASNSKREVGRIALHKLRVAAPAPLDVIPLPKGAPYGRIHIDTAGCTLCLACVSACPANALSDSTERPQVAFTETNCVQCGLCAATCPEKVISLETRYDFSNAAVDTVVLNSEEPFLCVSCGRPFGTKATMERVLRQLSGKHSMFQNEAQTRVIQMCEACRVVAMAQSANDPFKGAPRPPVRTTQDYLAEASQATRKDGGKSSDGAPS